MTNETTLLKETADKARAMLHVGAMTRDEAKARVQPYLDIVNTTAEAKARKYRVRFRPVSFAGFIR